MTEHTNPQQHRDEPYYHTADGTTGYQHAGHPDAIDGMYPGQQPPFAQQQYNQLPPERQKIGMGVTSLVIGIIAVLVSLVPFLAIIFGAAAIVVGIIALRRKQGQGFGVAGIITGGVGLVVSLAVGIFTVWVVNAFSDQVESEQEKFTESPQDVDDILNDLEDSLNEPFDEPADYNHGESDLMVEDSDNAELEDVASDAAKEVTYN